MVGLRPSPDLPATPVLAEMVHIARSFFQSLHTPEPFTVAHAAAQATLLDEVQDEYSHVPSPTGFDSGPFSMDEIPALFDSMPNTAPGPDGIPYSFWKSLHRCILAHNKENPQSGLVPFWDSFLDLANDVKLNGSSRCGFKNANISLFFKKGDPTLTANYCPISSMNTDCKMYTNLINNRLSPWAIRKLHDNQKGFVPGHLITDHTHLTSMVAHLAEATNSDGFIVSLDQAKAYNRVDQHWLLCVLSRMGLDPDLISLIKDLTHKCRSHVRINGGYSPFFTLHRGVRQGDPLSCLLFNFSIEPLAMRLCCAVRGFSVLDLPPVRVMFYADDVNLFLNKDEPITPIVECLDNTSFAIGSKFNHDKTDVKPIGTLTFQHACFDSSSLHGQALPGSFILPPSAPLRVLGIWVGSSGLAQARWLQISNHITRLICQWQAIGASLPNHVLLAKALMQSQCYYLLDGNSIPRRTLKKVSNRIMNFVRSPFCHLPFASLEAPLSSGGINCPSLVSRNTAYDLKFFGDLVSGPPSVPWKVWTIRDLTLFSHPSSSQPDTHLNPLLQRAFTKTSHLNDCLAAAFKSAQRVGLDLRSLFPSTCAIADQLILYHPAIPTQFMKLLACLATHGITNVSHLYSLPRRLYCKKSIQKVATLRKQLALTPWNLSSEPLHLTTSPAVHIWPTLCNPSGCIRIFTAPVSLLTKHYQVGSVPSPGAGYPFSPYARHDLPRLSVLTPAPFPSSVHIWTDGSALDNGLEHCTAGAAWTSNLCIYDYAALDGLPLDNNIAEVAAVIMALHSWRSGPIHIHTDSSFVLRLVKGGLLAMERDGWPSLPWLQDPVLRDNKFGHIQLASLYRHLLFLLCSHSGPLDFSWTHAHANNPMNVEADFLAKLGRTDGPKLWLDDLVTPDGWVDAYPVLNYQPLSAISAMVVEYTVPPPLLSSRSASFLV